jgi:hypothetical protein
VLLRVLDATQGKGLREIGTAVFEKPDIQQLSSAGKKGKSAGEVHLATDVTEQVPTVVDFLRIGVGVGLMAAIDFTTTNGKVSLESSLHYQGEKNRYEKLLGEFVDIVGQYGAKPMLFGFGGIVNGQDSPCFELPVKGKVPRDAVVRAYRTAVKTVDQAVPVMLSPLIITAMEIASERFRVSKRYMVLVIITCDGPPDEDETRDAIVRAANAPLIIVVVGIGGGDFSVIQNWASRGTELRSRNGAQAKRKVVYFINGETNPADVVAEALAEIPGPLSEFCATQGIVPK